MDPIGLPIDTFCEQLRAQAHRDTERIIDRAKRVAEETVERYRAEAAALREQILAATRQEVEQQRRKILADVNLEIKKLRLRAQGEITDEAVGAIRERLSALRGAPEWRDFLRDTIAEAAVTLDDTDVTLLAAPSDVALIEGDLLDEAVHAAEARAGHPITISVKTNSNHSGTGIVAIGRGGHAAFDNTAEARLERRLDALAVLIHKECFPTE